VRPARPDDAGPLTALVFASKASVGYDDAFMQACRAELAVTPERLRVGRWWVAQDASGRLGCCQLLADASRPEAGRIEVFFVHPSSQRGGVGRALWSVLSDAARADGLTGLELDADPAAVGFYRRLGFVGNGSVPSGSIAGRRLPRMVLSLVA